MSERNLRVFDFVLSRANQSSAAPTWRQLMKEYNNQRYRNKPGWQYQDVRVFSRDYWRTAQKLVFPSYGQIVTHPDEDEQPPS